MSRYLVLYVVLVIVIPVGISFTDEWRLAYGLKVNGVLTDAFVQKTNCGSHSSFEYHYSVSGASYSGSGTSDRCAQLKAGEKVHIYYVREAPALSTSRSRYEPYDFLVILMVLASIVAPPLVVLRVKQFAEAHTKEAAIQAAIPPRPPSAPWP
jgi:hypothetical protein